MRTKITSALAPLAAIVLAIALSAPAHALTFNFTYNSSVINLPYAAQVQTAINYVAQELSNQFSDNITLNITIASNTTSFGGSNSSLTSVSGGYSTVRTQLMAAPQSTND